MAKTIFVVGAGKGLGNRTAEKFGRNGFRVVLMARHPQHLAEYRKEFEDKGIEVYTAPVDISDRDAVTRTFSDLIEQFGTPDVLFCNVGITVPDASVGGEKDADLLVERYGTDVAGIYHAIRQVLGEKFSEKKGAVLVTGGGLALFPSYEFLPLSMDKAALRAMSLALHNELKKQGVYLGLLTVTDVIAPGGKCDPEVLADEYWKMYTDRADAEVTH